MRWIFGGLALAVLAGCTDVNLFEPGGTSIAGVSGFDSSRWAIIRYVDKGSEELLARRHAEASRLMREFCHPQKFLVFEKERTGDSGRMRIKFRCQSGSSSINSSGG